MARINIYVPDDLKAEMDRLPDVNWSQVFRSRAARIVISRKATPESGLEEMFRKMTGTGISLDDACLKRRAS